MALLQNPASLQREKSDFLSLESGNLARSGKARQALVQPSVPRPAAPGARWPWARCPCQGCSREQTSCRDKTGHAVPSLWWLWMLPSGSLEKSVFREAPTAAKARGDLLLLSQVCSFVRVAPLPDLVLSQINFLPKFPPSPDSFRSKIYSSDSPLSQIHSFPKFSPFPNSLLSQIY